MSIEMTFCLKCNREVLPEDTVKDSTFFVNNGNIIRIDDRLLHKGCNGILRPILLDYGAKTY